MSLFQEKISSFFNPTPSLKMKPLPNKSIPDLNSLQKYPKLFLHFVGNKHDSHYFVQHLKNIDLYEERKKSSYTKNVLKGLEKIPIHDVKNKIIIFFFI